MAKSSNVELWETPAADEIYMIAGWHQWADAGSVSSALPRYLVDEFGARQIGRIRPDGFYLFQIPGMQHLLRPEIKLENGFCEELRVPDNQIYYWQSEGKGLVIFMGDEPHLNVEGYTEAFFEVAEQLGVRRIASVGGVYAPVPYDKHREISCTYSLRGLHDELERYGVSFSNYSGGTTICSYFLPRAVQLGIEYLVFYAMVPLYDLSQLSSDLDAVGVEEDYGAWYDVMTRLNTMFNLGLDLTDLRQRSNTVVDAMHSQLARLERKVPQAKLHEYVAQLSEGFEERTFPPLGDVWEQELGDLFGDQDD